jgi:hypothetical protein
MDSHSNKMQQNYDCEGNRKISEEHLCTGWLFKVTESVYSVNNKALLALKSKKYKLSFIKARYLKLQSH